jgi:hypothetical protein
VGEGGDPGGEYIIPAKKMAAASMAYLSGARGASVIDGRIPGFADGGFVSNSRARNNGIKRVYSIGGELIKGEDKDFRRKMKNALQRIGAPDQYINAYFGNKLYNSSESSLINGMNPKDYAKKMGLKYIVERQPTNDKPRPRDVLTSSPQYAQSQIRSQVARGKSNSPRGLAYIANEVTGIFNSAEGDLRDLFKSKVPKDFLVEGFAKGGYVNRPTLGWIGEGGESEYIIPSSRMAQSAMAYLNGSRGAAVLKAPGFATGGYVGGPDRSGNPLQALMDRVGTIDSLTVNEPPQINDGPIQVTTGPVLDFDGQRYVTMEDYQRGLRDVKRQTLGEIRTAAGRRATGR